MLQKHYEVVNHWIFYLVSVWILIALYLSKVQTCVRGYNSVCWTEVAVGEDAAWTTSKETEIALRLGIYDLIFGPFTIGQVLKLVKNANNLSDIAGIYNKIFKIEEDSKWNIDW